MSNDLLQPSDLDGQAGTPFTQAEVDAAVEALRGTLGWHVAPAKQETVVLDFESTSWRVLPTRRLVSVDDVRDSAHVTLGHRATRTDPYRLILDSEPRSPFEVDVTMTHGFDSCPADLLPVIADAIRSGRDEVTGDVRMISSGPLQISYGAPWTSADEPPPFSTAATLRRYQVFDVGFA